MGQNNRCNFINFIRGEFLPRNHPLDYMFEQVYEQVGLARRYQVETTFLLEYDALIEPKFTDFLKAEEGDLIEVGAWLETPQRLIEDAGYQWRGREGYTWDWYNDVGFLIGYTPEERIKIIDTYFAKFKELFGRYPTVIGCWHIDAVSLKHINDTYDVLACCMCREQVGTDGYTLWGGYLNGYYPSLCNSFTPAGSTETSIGMPMFRMLGEDPIYNYDHQYLVKEMGFPSSMNAPNTMEPFYTCFGADPKWIDWYLEQIKNPLNRSFSYLQVGQENGFGWKNVKAGLTAQLERLVVMQQKGEIVLEKFSKTAKWFRETFATTPTHVTAAETDWMGGERRSYWYLCKNYRANLYKQYDHFWLRDLYLFDDSYPERCLESTCTTHGTTYDNLPLIDGCNWSDAFVRAGLYPVVKQTKKYRLPNICAFSAEHTEQALHVKIGTDVGEIKLHFTETEITLEAPHEILWQFRYALPENDIIDADNHSVTAWDDNITSFDETTVYYRHNARNYTLNLLAGRIGDDSKTSCLNLLPANGKLILCPQKTN